MPKKPPTLEQMVLRTYRKVLALEKALAAFDRRLLQTHMEAEGARVRISNLQDRFETRMNTLAPIVNHCDRLLREKEILRQLIYPTEEEMQLRQVNSYMARPIS